MKDRPIHIKAVLFQLQTTVAQQRQLEEENLKAGIGCPSQTPLFDYIQNLPEPDNRKQILSDLEDLELKEVTKLNPDAAFLETIPYLTSKNIRPGILSTVGAKASRQVLQRFRSRSSAAVEVIAMNSGRMDRRLI
jgi:hypothetical protein